MAINDFHLLMIRVLPMPSVRVAHSSTYSLEGYLWLTARWLGCRHNIPPLGTLRAFS
jgi:hypothetical protein